MAAIKKSVLACGFIAVPIRAAKDRCIVAQKL
jgi:hypothetical protein